MFPAVKEASPIEDEAEGGTEMIEVCQIVSPDPCGLCDAKVVGTRGGEPKRHSASILPDAGLQGWALSFLGLPGDSLHGRSQHCCSLPWCGLTALQAVTSAQWTMPPLTSPPSPLQCQVWERSPFPSPPRSSLRSACHSRATINRWAGPARSRCPRTPRPSSSNWCTSSITPSSWRDSSSRRIWAR